MQKKNEKNDFKKSVICSGQAYLSHGSIVWTQVILFMFEINIPSFVVPLHSMSLTFLLNTAILCSCSSILSFSLPTIEMMESSLFLNSLSVRDVARGCRFFLSQLSAVWATNTRSNPKKILSKNNRAILADQVECQEAEMSIA